jgi:hypothetical protein
MREHDCGTPDMAVFLDITHGLFSLCWSNPIEWPHFITEYKAYYRNKKEWNTLIESCGFIQQPFNAVTQANYDTSYSKPKRDGYIPNVIKSFYAVYAPNPTFTF